MKKIKQSPRKIGQNPPTSHLTPTVTHAYNGRCEMTFSMLSHHFLHAFIQACPCFRTIFSLLSRQSLHELFCRSVATLHDVYTLLWYIQATTTHIVVFCSNFLRCRNRINTACSLIREIARSIVCHLHTHLTFIISYSAHKFLAALKHLF